MIGYAVYEFTSDEKTVAPDGKVVAPKVVSPVFDGELEKMLPGLHKLKVNIPNVGEVKYTIYIPDGYKGEVAPLVLMLHYGYQGERPDPYTGAEMIDVFRDGLAEFSAITIAPDAAGGNWTDRHNESAALWLVKSAMNTYNIDSKNIIISGYSMGGKGSWFIGSRHQDIFTGAIPIAAPLSNVKSWGIPAYIIHSKEDKTVSYSEAKTNAEKLKSGGVKVVFKNAKGLGHFELGGYGEYFLDAIKWIRQN